MIIPIVALLSALAVPSVTSSQALGGQALLASTPQTLEEYVKEYFKEDPIMIEVARCESQFRHLNKDGTILRGVVNPSDVGVMQINLYYHESDAEKLGLYDKKGTAPWSASKPCWGKTKKS
jgi:hypothetical protein